MNCSRQNLNSRVPQNKKKILLISSGQPSLNPRLVKEADALADAGYEVTVLYAYWNAWATKNDSKLLPAKKWKAVRVGGDPDNKPALYFISRLVHRFSIKIASSLLIDYAIARAGYFLTRAAKQLEADLYIAHNLAALPAVVKAARHFKKPCGFDAEDFHRFETSDDENNFDVKSKIAIEDKYLPQTGYVTASSPLIAAAYKKIYPFLSPVTILNVFPVHKGVMEPAKIGTGNIKLFWFSQTIGPHRGLETVIEAIKLTGLNIEFHVLGSMAAGYKKQLIKDTESRNTDSGRVYIYEPMLPDEIFSLAAQFDIGVASETGFSLNNRYALSNKIFTYILSGLALLASNTPAQAEFLKKYPQTGNLYNNADELAAQLIFFHENRHELLQARKSAFILGQTELNWNTESEKFLAVIKDQLGKGK